MNQFIGGMGRAVWFAGCLLFAASLQAAEFDVFQAAYKPSKLAWVVNAAPEGNIAKQQVHDVVRDDLQSSRSFVEMDPLSFLSSIKDSVAHVDYADWRIIGTDILAVCRLRSQGKGWVAHLNVHDPFRSQLLLSVEITQPDGDLRYLAHLIANRIYQAATGLPGYFTSHVLYVRKHGDRADLVYMDQDGANKQTVGRNFTLLLSPDWSPDQRLVVLNTYVGNRPRLETFDLVTGRRRIIGSFKGLNSTPVWSPDGRFIAAALSYTGNAELHLYNVKTGKWRQLTHHKGIDTSPSWSPDGQWIAFTSNRNGSPQIYRIHVSDGRVERISRTGKYNTSPTWSPSGDRIAFITQQHWAFALATMRVDGSDVRYLVTGGRIESPAWSPNAQMLLFSNEVKGARKVYRVPAWGGSTEVMTLGNEDASDPAWSH